MTSKVVSLSSACAVVDSFGQRQSGKLHEDLEARGGAPRRIPRSRRRTSQHRRFPREDLQHQAASLRAGLPSSGGVRSALGTTEDPSMSFRGMGRSVNAKKRQEAGAMTASRWSATQPAHSAHREERADGTRFDESSAGYPSTSCSPAELASVSPTDAILLNINQVLQRKIAARPTVSKLVSHARGQVHSMLYTWNLPGSTSGITL